LGRFFEDHFFSAKRQRTILKPWLTASLLSTYRPPVTRMISPVTWRLTRDPRKTINAATSSGVTSWRVEVNCLSRFSHHR
jgi:hypothetical protein